MDDNFRRLIKELGHAINESLAESERVSDVMARIRAAGYDLFLVLEVTIGFNKHGETGALHRQKLAEEGDSKERAFELTDQDAQFLQALKITIESDQE